MPFRAEYLNTIFDLTSAKERVPYLVEINLKEFMMDGNKNISD